MKKLVVLGIAILFIGTTACDFGGWYGEPPKPIVTVEGVVLSRDLAAKDTTIWTIEGDSTSYVPDHLPREFREDSSRVVAQGQIGEPPEYYPSGVLLEVKEISNVVE